MSSFPEIDLAHLFKLRVVVARVGEMDLAKWWNTNGQLGRFGAAALRRGLPRTHSFAQARSVAAVAANRCAEVFDPPGSVTLWRLPQEIEDRYEARWEHWLDDAADWKDFFAQVSAIADSDVAGALTQLGLVAPAQVGVIRNVSMAAGARSVHVSPDFKGTREDLELLALGFARGTAGSLVVPYARLGAG